MDISSIAGIILGMLGIIGGLLLEGGQMSDIIQYTAFIIVAFGTVGAVLIQFPFKVFLQGVKAFKKVVFDSTESPTELINTIVDFANKARKEGLVSLEDEVKKIKDPFFQKAMMMAIDGSSIKDVRDTLDLELEYMEEHGKQAAKVWEAAGGYAPTIGILGAVMGLIQVMKNLQDIDEVGHGIAVAFVATIYGVGGANLVLLPVATKVALKHRWNIIMKEMIVSGVLLMIEGINPRVIKEKLYNFFDEEEKAHLKAG
ncbi:MAG: flagellar motor protein [Deltaproteobacteria bacterium]|nr:flagellar motor protein [Deltaproteobacteria bacterium]